MSSRKATLSVITLLTITMVLSSVPHTQVAATEPEDIVLTYDFGTQIITVNVSHYVANTKTHYIEDIEIKNDGISVHNQTYTNQSNNWYVYESISVSASVDDNLTVIANCKKGYSLTRWLIVTSTTSTSSTPTQTTTTSTTTPPPDQPDSPGDTLGVGIAIAGGGVIVIVFVLLYIERDRLPESIRQIGRRIHTGTLTIFSRMKIGISNLVQQIRVRLGSR